MEYKYKAFISYNHNERDSRVARLLHNRIETYTVPRKLRKNGKKKPGKVFRDQEELSASSDLNQHIRDALDESEFLIVICSPGAVASKWVSKEIAYFLEHHKQEKLLTVLTDGDGADIYKALLPGMPEPLSLDMTGIPDKEIPRKLKERFLKLCAPLLGCEYDELVMRDQKRKRRQMMWWMAGIAAVAAAIISILLWSNWRIEGKNQELDQKNEELDQKNEELDQKNEELEQQNQELLLRESEILTQEALEALHEGDRYGAIEKSLAALPDPQRERPVYTPATQVLFAALKPFREKEQNYIFRKTVLSQETAVKDFCIDSTGGLLTTADQFNTLTCFDTVTGEVRWRTEIYQKYVYEEPQVYYCGRWDCVLFFNKEVIASVSQQTGELLWSMTPKYAQNEHLILEEQNGVFTFLLREYGTGEIAYSLMLCSAKTGEVLGKIHIITVQQALLEVRCHFPESSQKDYRIGDFSSDGRFYAGCYFTDDNRIHYFLADTQELTCREICTGAASSMYDGVVRIKFSNQEDLLFVIRNNPEKKGYLRIECIQLHDGAILWAQEVEGYTSDGIICAESDPLLFSVDRELYCLRQSNGEIRCRIEMYDVVEDLYWLEDGGFSYLLQNGVTAAGWISGAGFVDTQYFLSELFDLGSCAEGQLWNGGSTHLIHEGTKVKGFDMRDEHDGGGYAAMIPQEDDHCVVIQRPVQLVGMQKTEYSEQIPEMVGYTGQLVDKETLVFFNLYGGEMGEDVYQTVVLDPVTLRQKACYATEYCLFDDTLYLPGGSSYIQTNYKEINLVDLKTGMTTELIDEYFLNSWMEDPEKATYVLESASGRLPESGDVISVAAAMHGIRIWRNGVHMKDAAYPVQIAGSDQRFKGVTVHMGENGMAVVSSMSENGTRLFLAYDVLANCWYQIPTELPYEESFELICGSSDPVFLVHDSNGMALLYDIPSQLLYLGIPTAVPLTALKNMQLCMKDDYVLFYTKDRDVSIYDTASGKAVYEERHPWRSSEPLHCYEDPQRQQLYLVSEFISDPGYCLATDTWYLMAEISNLVLCNEHTGRILQRKDDFSGDVSELWLSSVMTAEELISYGHTVIGE